MICSLLFVQKYVTLVAYFIILVIVDIRNQVIRIIFIKIIKMRIFGPLEYKFQLFR